jgi:hypothetical protein
MEFFNKILKPKQAKAILIMSQDHIELLMLKKREDAE